MGMSLVDVRGLVVETDGFGCGPKQVQGGRLWKKTKGSEYTKQPARYLPNIP